MATIGYSYRYMTLRQFNPAGAAKWLSPRERLDALRMRDTRQRDAWLAGRLVVKQLLAERLASQGTGRVTLSELEINSRDGQGRKVRPQGCCGSRLLDWTLSISHSNRAVLAAVASPDVAVGVDLAPSEAQLGRGFEQVWFSPEERRWLNGNSGLTPLAAWAVKEAAYKALNSGEPFDPRRLHVEPAPNGGWTCRLVRVRKTANCRVTVWRTPCNELAALATSTNSTPIIEPEFNYD